MRRDRTHSFDTIDSLSFDIIDSLSFDTIDSLSFDTIDSLTHIHRAYHRVVPGLRHARWRRSVTPGGAESHQISQGVYLVKELCLLIYPNHHQVREIG